MKRLVVLTLCCLLATPAYAVEYLKQSTAVTLKIGPFVDETDGKTAETGLTLSQADFRLSKNGGDFAQKNESTSGTHDEIGYYDVPVNTTDTGTLGRLLVAVHESGALPVWKEYMVLPANTYDSLVSGSDALNADVDEWNGTAVATPDTAGYPKVTIKDGTGTGEVDTTSGAIASANVRSLPNVWYVDDGGNDSNDGKTVSTPKLTISAAVSAAIPGDTIYLGAGTYSGAVTVSKNNLTIVGEGAANTTITHNSGYTFTLSGNNCTLRGLNIVASAETSNGTALTVASTVGTNLEWCRIDGKFDGLFTDSAENLTIFHCRIFGTYDAANFNAVKQCRVEHTRFTSTANWATSDDEFRAVVIVNSATSLVTDTTQIDFKNCDFAVARTGTSATSKDTIAVRVGGRVVFDGCHFRARSTNASYTGNVYGIVGEALFTGTPTFVGYIDLKGGSVRSAKNGGSSTDLFTSLSGSEIHTVGALYTTASGNVYNDGPTAALVNTAVEGGTVGTNANTAATQASAANTVVSSGTHGNEALKTLVDAKASQASVDDAQTDIDTIITNVDSANSTLATMGPKIDATKAATDKLDLMIDDSNPSEPKYNEPSLENAPSGGEGGDPVAADVVDDSRTWFATDYRARNIISVAAPFEGTLALKPDLNPGTTIKETDSVTIVGPEVDDEPLEPVATSFTVNRAKDRAHCNVPELTVPGDYDFTWTVETVDGQVLTTTGTLKVH